MVCSLCKKEMRDVIEHWCLHHPKEFEDYLVEEEHYALR